MAASLPWARPQVAAVLARIAAGDVADVPVNVQTSSGSSGLSLSGASTVQAGTPYTLTIGDGGIDLGTGPYVGYTVNWGDGSETEVSADALVAQDGQVTHTFSSTSVGITDEPGRGHFQHQRRHPRRERRHDRRHHIHARSWQRQPRPWPNGNARRHGNAGRSGGRDRGVLRRHDGPWTGNLDHQRRRFRGDPDHSPAGLRRSRLQRRLCRRRHVRRQRVGGAGGVCGPASVAADDERIQQPDGRYFVPPPPAEHRRGKSVDG